jgi:tetratricopeptide (TPR) repeat protein
LQIDLLLAQAYQYWDKPGDALSVYDELIASHEDDFRAYLAKGILLKQRNREAEAEQYLEKVSNMPALKSLAESLQKLHVSLRCERRLQRAIVPT